MKHNLKISVSKKQNPGGLVNCRSVTVRERILRFFLGTPQRMMILVPGDSIEELAICEIGGKE